MGCELTYTCPGCGFALPVWDNGYRTYIRDPQGKKHAVMHPCERDTIDHVVALYPDTKGMSPVERENFAGQLFIGRQEGICLDCAKRFTSSVAPKPKKCRHCKSSNTVWLEDIGGKVCPKCKAASFPTEGEFTCIS